MNNLHNLVSEELVNTTLYDDIDQLYYQLEQIEPPTFLVSSIMASVAHLPQGQEQPEDVRGHVASLNDLGEFLMRGFGIQLS